MHNNEYQHEISKYYIFYKYLQLSSNVQITSLMFPHPWSSISVSTIKKKHIW